MAFTLASSWGEVSVYLLREMPGHIGAGSLSGVDFTFEAFSFTTHRPLDVLTDKGQVFVVGLALLIENADLPARQPEYFRIQRRVRGRQRGGIKPVFLVFG